MPWSEVSVMDLRLEFVMLARQPGANVAALCRRFGISRKTGYKWLRRVGSRNPCRPSSTPPSIRSAASSMADGSASRARRSNCPRAFAGYPVGLLPTTRDGIWNVIFASRHIAQLDRRQGTTKTVTHVSEHL